MTVMIASMTAAPAASHKQTSGKLWRTTHIGHVLKATRCFVLYCTFWGNIWFWYVRIWYENIALCASADQHFALLPRIVIGLWRLWITAEDTSAVTQAWSWTPHMKRKHSAAPHHSWATPHNADARNILACLGTARSRNIWNRPTEQTRNRRTTEQTSPY